MDILNFAQLLEETKYGSQFNVPLYYVVEKIGRIYDYGTLQPNDYKVQRIGSIGEITFSENFKYDKGFKFCKYDKVISHYNYPYTVYVATQKQILIDKIKGDIDYRLIILEDEAKSIKGCIKNLRYSLQQLNVFETINENHTVYNVIDVR